MKLGILAATLSLGAAALGFETPASAESYQIVVTGKFIYVVDSAGFFGVPLAPGFRQDDGLTYTETFTLDPSLGDVVSIPGQTRLSGGSASAGLPVGPISVVLAANGHSISYGRQTAETIQHDVAAGISADLFMLDSFEGGRFGSRGLGVSVISTYNGPIAPLTLGTPFDFIVKSDDQVYAHFDSPENAAGGALSVTEISSGTVSSAPEPSTWTLMMTALGATGLVLRRSRSTRKRQHVGSFSRKHLPA